ncbi:MAG: ATP-dependent helicase [Planctomyces sp.]|jgi:ATP-dependent RNA helicase DeaD|nr:ATP-dependent helicase [Planctomyces sp.]
METKTVSFEDLGLSDITLAAVRKMGFKSPSPIQAAFVPLAMTGQDVIGQARTGTGKTAAFVLPILERIDHHADHPQALVLTPTRELSQQISEEALKLSLKHPLRSVCCVGGRNIRPQITELKKGCQLVIGTPGRIIDLMQRGELDTSRLKMVILDEADRMLDIGFRPDIERILRKCPSERQTLLLSATLPAPVARLAQKYMNNPERVDLSDVGGVSHSSIQQYYVPVDHDRKFRTLVKVLSQEKPQQVLVFTRTKRGAEEVYRKFNGRLPRIGFIHGDLSQSLREGVLSRFRDGRLRLLIATDVMGRGIDISGISHIVNYDVPQDCDDYVHRIGRTGRLSSTEKIGSAITFVTREEGDQLTNIEIRVNKELARYEIDGFETQRPRRPARHVNDLV